MMMPSWGFGVGGGYPSVRRFDEQYHCYSVAAAGKSQLEKGDKILLPPSAFDTLARLQVDYPMLFRLSAGEQKTHSGVLEFTAEEGCCYIPYWMMQNLLIDEGSLLTVTNVSLPKCTFVKLQPQSVDFLEISNPRAVLEHALRNFSCVTVGDVIQIPYNNKNFHFELKDVKPSPAACIIETDCNVDFDAPVGYKEPTPPAAAAVPGSQRSSACPSPAATMSTTSSMPAEEETVEKEPTGTRIVNGEIVRPDETTQPSIQTNFLAQRTGQTGVQQNSAVPKEAPKVDYWAVNAGDGARLDGKKPAELKDTSGNTVDVRQLRAEAAARRAKEAEEATMRTSLGRTEGKTLDGKPPTTEPAATVANAAPISKRKKLGSKYSRLKQSSAFQGAAQSFK